MASKTDKWRADIQGLKALAVINLFLFHINHKLFSNGFIAIDMFFVITGYLARMALNNSLNIRYIKNYAIKRIKRIILPYYSIILLIIHLRLFFLKGSTDYLSFTFLTCNIIRNECVSKFEHFWLLPIVLQFQFIAPFLLPLRLVKMRQLIFVFTILFSFILYVFQYEGISQNLLKYLWQFLIGSAVCELDASQDNNTKREKNEKSSYLIKIITIVSLCLISPLSLIIEINKQFYKIISSFATAWLLKVKCLSFLNHRYLILIGDHSFSIYLAYWTYILLIKCEENFSNFTNLHDFIDTILFILLLSTIIYEFLEKFFLRFSINDCLIFIFITLILSFLIFHLNRTRFTNTMLDTVEPVTIASGPMNPHNDTTQNDTILAEIIKINRLNKLSKFPAIPGLKMIDDLPTLYKLKRIGVTNANVSYYKGSGNITVVILGNSLALSALHYIVPAFGLHRIRHIKLLSASGCIPIYNVEAPKNRHPKCPEFSKVAMEIIQKMMPDVIFLNFMFIWSLRDPIKNISNDVLLYKLQKTIDDMMKYTRRIVFSYDNPYMPDNLPSPDLISTRLAKRLPIEDLNIPFKEYWNISRNAYRRINALRCKKCEFVHIYRWLCDSKICRTYDSETLITYYADRMHFGMNGIKFLIPFYKKLIEELYAKEYI